MRFVGSHLLPLFLLAQPAVKASSYASSSALAVLQNIDYRFFVAGGSCAAISHGITTPIDVVKTKIQAAPQKYNKGMLKATADILKEEGAGALLGGLGPTVVGYGIEGAMKFGAYEVLKPVFADFMRSLSSADGDGNMAVAYLMASVVAGALAAMLLCPMESTRIRIVTDPEYSDKGLLAALSKMVKDDGIFSSFNGLWAMLAKQVRSKWETLLSTIVELFSYFSYVSSSRYLTPSANKFHSMSLLECCTHSFIRCRIRSNLPKFRSNGQFPLLLPFWPRSSLAYSRNLEI